MQQNMSVLINRLFMVTLMLQRELFERINSSKKEIKYMEEYKIDISRIVFFCKRILRNGSDKINGLSSFSVHSIVSTLKQIESSLNKIANLKIDWNKYSFDENTKKLFKKTIEMQEINMKLFQQMSSKEKSTEQIKLFKKHKKLRDSIKSDLEFYKKDPINSFKQDVQEVTEQVVLGIILMMNYQT